MCVCFVFVFDCVTIKLKLEKRLFFLVKPLNQPKVLNVWVRVPLEMLVIRVPGLLSDDPGVSLILVLLVALLLFIR